MSHLFNFNPACNALGSSLTKRGMLALLAALNLVACGGGSNSSLERAPTEKNQPASKAAQAFISPSNDVAPLIDSPGWELRVGEGIPPVLGLKALANAPTTQADAVRLANQGTFGATEPLISQIRQTGPLVWIAQQMATSRSNRGTIRPVVVAPTPKPFPALGLHKPMVSTDVSMSSSALTSGGDGAVHQYSNASGDFCDGRGENCWRDWSSSIPLLWDFYRNAVSEPDQLRQRVGWALQQILVVSNLEVFGTYGLRNYNNALLDQAFGNYREVLRGAALSPVMGDYLNNVNNDKAAPNENFARELLQLFSLGTCELNTNGTLRTGNCVPTYDNETVRNYAFALTGWTYPPGGATPWGCWPTGSNCQYYGGNMVPVASFHDTASRALLSGVNLSPGHNANQALDSVLDSLMTHPNMAPFVGRQLIQHLVTSNPSPAYVQRVANAFIAGRFQGFGTGQRGDMKATIAAILLDAEARTASPANTAGRLREPAQFFTGVLRALNGRTDGDALGWWWGEELRQHAFRSPSVFNFYPPDYPVAGTSLVGPAFALHSTNAALQRVNYVNYLIFWNGSDAQTGVPGGLGTRVDLSAFVSDATNPGKLVDRLSMLALGAPLPTAARTVVVNAVGAYTAENSGDDYRTNRVKQAAYLIFASPNYQIVR